MPAILRLLLCAAASLLTPPLYAEDAATARSTLDVYFVPQADLEVTGSLGSDSDKGDGFGIRALILPGMGTAFITAGISAEYQTNTFDSTLDYDQVRVGVGLVHPSSSGVFFEIDQFEVEGEETNGLSAHGRFATRIGQAAQVYADLAYLWLEDENQDLTGLEYTIGAALGDAGFGVFADYRITQLETELSNAEIELRNLRLGVRWGFGG
ncbi:MAG TPA: hypothetical protein VM240_01015 [Verrucomicrobiae bacterium]|nr:hypothetical protein [Verrucomicrobiae bacterium]